MAQRCNKLLLEKNDQRRQLYYCNISKPYAYIDSIWFFKYFFNIFSPFLCWCFSTIFHYEHLFLINFRRIHYFTALCQFVVFASQNRYSSLHFPLTCYEEYCSTRAKLARVIAARDLRYILVCNNRVSQLVEQCTIIEYRSHALCTIINCTVCPRIDTTISIRYKKKDMNSIFWDQLCLVGK